MVSPLSKHFCGDRELACGETDYIHASVARYLYRLVIIHSGSESLQRYAANDTTGEVIERQLRTLDIHWNGEAYDPLGAVITAHYCDSAFALRRNDLLGSRRSAVLLNQFVRSEIACRTIDSRSKEGEISLQLRKIRRDGRRHVAACIHEIRTRQQACETRRHRAVAPARSHSVCLGERNIVRTGERSNQIIGPC